jgi:uncharacterized protein (TIGR00369 family)
MIFQPKNINYQDAIREVLQKQSFMDHIGFKTTKIEPGHIEGSLEFRDFLEQQNGYLHGGVIATVADMVCGFAAHTLVAENEYVVTSDLKISYLNPGVGNVVLAKGWVIKAGSRMLFCEAEIIDQATLQLIAKASATMVIVPKQNVR